MFEMVCVGKGLNSKGLFSKLYEEAAKQKAVSSVAQLANLADPAPIENSRV